MAISSFSHDISSQKSHGKPPVLVFPMKKAIDDRLCAVLPEKKSWENPIFSISHDISVQKSHGKSLVLVFPMKKSHGKSAISSFSHDISGQKSHGKIVFGFFPMKKWKTGGEEHKPVPIQVAKSRDLMLK